MTDLFSWNVTIAGALLCLLYSWFLTILGRSQKVRFGKVVTALGIVGTFVLAGMAYVGPLHNPKSKFEGVHSMSEDISEGRLANLKRRSLAIRTITKLGPRPDRDHVPWEFPDRRLAWITKSEYRKLRKEEKEGEK